MSTRPKPTLTPAQQTIVDKMAKGFRLFKFYRHPKSKVRHGFCLRHENHLEEVVNANTALSLISAGVVIPQFPAPEYGPFEQLITELGLSLARKDGENG